RVHDRRGGAAHMDRLGGDARQAVTCCYPQAHEVVSGRGEGGGYGRAIIREAAHFCEVPPESNDRADEVRRGRDERYSFSDVWRGGKPCECRGRGAFDVVEAPRHEA